jgi:chemotaxis protein CheX
MQFHGDKNMAGLLRDLELVNPFVFASFSVMSMLFGETPNKGSMYYPKEGDSSYEFSVVIGLTGGVKGHVVLGMSLETAQALSKAMLGRESELFEEIWISAIEELGNMVCGSGLLLLSEDFGVSDLTPPSVRCGLNADISDIVVSAANVPLTTSFGKIDLLFNLEPQKLAVVA